MMSKLRRLNEIKMDYDMRILTYFRLSVLIADSSDSTGRNPVRERDELAGGSKCIFLGILV